MEKRCFRCLQTKEIEDFYKHSAMRDGHLNKCIDCTKADALTHRLANLERIRAYDRSRGAAPHRVAARKEYQATPQGRAAHKRALKVSAARYPDRAASRMKFGNAVRDGRVMVWPVCAVPACSGKPEGHHPVYAQPLNVVWLCNTHHRQAHEASEELEAA